MAPVAFARLVGQQAEEDGGHLGAGDVGPRPDRAVLIADDIGDVVLGVEAYRRIVRLGNRSYGRVVLVPDEDKGREAGSADRELYVCAGVFNRDGSDVARVDAALNDINAHLAVEALKVEQCKAGVPPRTCREWPVDGDVLIRRDPGVAVVGVYEVEILRLISPRRGGSAELRIRAVYEQLRVGNGGAFLFDDVVKEQHNAGIL